MNIDLVIIIAAVALCLWASICPRLLHSEQQAEIVAMAQQLVAEGKVRTVEVGIHALCNHFDYSYKGTI